MAKSEPIFAGAGENDKHVVLPCAARLTTSQCGKADKWSIHYEEDFVDPPDGMIERSLAAFAKTLAKAMPQLRARAKRRRNIVTVMLRGRGLTRAQVGNMMSGEFFAWGSLGRVSLSDLLGLTAYAQGLIPEE